jgi:acetyl esterase/lipase
MISWQARVFNQFLKIAGRRHPGKRTIADFRRMVARVDKWFTGLPRGVLIEEQTLGDVPVRWVRLAARGKEGAAFLIHGGAWCVETPNLHTGLAARLAVALGMNVVMPHYRLAPEYPFPAASEDCWAAWQGLLQSGVDPARVVLIGDSAGGALALGLMSRLHQAGMTQPQCGLLLSPATDLAIMGRSVVENHRSDAMFRITTLFLFRNWYLGDTSPTHPLASPYWGEFTGFPPLMFQVSGAEMLLDNSVFAAAKAQREGVAAQLSIWPGMPHDFTLFAFLPEARSGIGELVQFVAASGQEAPR